MPVEIRVECSWDTDDEEGRTVEVTTHVRHHPSEDPEEDTRYFAAGDLEQVKLHLCELVDRYRSAFVHPDRRECNHCGRVIATSNKHEPFVCEECTSK